MASEKRLILRCKSISFFQTVPLIYHKSTNCTKKAMKIFKSALALSILSSARAFAPLRQAVARASTSLAAEEYDYDFVVIGGGSGGVRASRIAAGHGAKTVLLEGQLQHGAPNYSAIGG